MRTFWKRETELLALARWRNKSPEKCRPKT